MAGVELIGVILASIPLVISAIEHYRDGLDPLTDYFRYDCTLKSFRTQLRLQQHFFQGTLKLLLLRDLSPHEVCDLFPDAGQHMDVGLWGKSNIHMELLEKLHEQLGSKYDDFMDAVREMESVMRKLMKGLEIEPNWQDHSRGSLLTLKIEKWKWEWRKLKRSFRRKRWEDLLREFERRNDHLAKLVGQWEILAPSPNSRPKALSQHYCIVREDACKIYNALENSWKCRHPCSHTVSLQLESRGSGEGLPHFIAALSFQDQSSGSQTSEQKWVETRLHVAESKVQIPPGSTYEGTLTTQSVERSPSANALDQSSSATSSSSGLASCTEPHQRIRSLCETLQSPQKPFTISGFLTNASLEQRIAISTGPPTPPIVGNLVSLDRLFDAREVFTQSRESFGCLSGRQRLSIAVILAHTVLQLHDSPWLTESWGKNDIWFFSSGVDRHKRPNIEPPYISRSFKPRSDQNASTPGEESVAQTDPYSHLIINKTLFALGIVLIELALNRPLEKFRIDAMSSEPSASNRSYTTADTYQLATSLIDMVYDEQGTQYGYVVQRCLRCEFGFQDSMKRLEIEEFRAAVYEGVLVPLEEDFNRYSVL